MKRLRREIPPVLLNCQSGELRTLASHSIPATEMPRRRMTVMVPMIRISLMLSVIMESVLCQKHEEDKKLNRVLTSHIITGITLDVRRLFPLTIMGHQ